MHKQNTFVVKTFMYSICICRFTKSVTISNTSLTNDKNTQKHRKRGKDKKRTKSESSLNITLNLPANSDPLDNVNAYIGVPLVSSVT